MKRMNCQSCRSNPKPRLKNFLNRNTRNTRKGHAISAPSYQPVVKQIDNYQHCVCHPLFATINSSEHFDAHCFAWEFDHQQRQSPSIIPIRFNALVCGA